MNLYTKVSKMSLVETRESMLREKDKPPKRKLSEFTKEEQVLIRYGRHLGESLEESVRYVYEERKKKLRKSRKFLERFRLKNPREVE